MSRVTRTHPAQIPLAFRTRVLRAGRVLAASMLLLGSALVLVGFSMGSAQAQPADITITVTVPSAAPSNSPSAVPLESALATDTPSPAPSDSPVPFESPVTETPAVGFTSAGNSGRTGSGVIAGVLFVSGLHAELVESTSALQKDVHLSMTLHNGSKSAIDLSSKFWITSLVGTTIGAADGIPVRALAPGQSRVLEATLSGLGQWTVMHAYATITPPALVDGVKALPLSRETFITVPPLLVIGGGAIAAGGAAVSWLVYLRRPIMMSLSKI